LLTAFPVQTRHAIGAIALWLGVLALMVQSLEPAYAVSAAAAGQGSSIVICTAHGFQTVRVDADGTATAGKSSANSSDCCNDYHAAGGFIVPSPVRFAVPFLMGPDAPSFRTQPILVARFYSSYITRGPPLLVI
jgi:hypothetical protein